MPHAMYLTGNEKIVTKTNHVLYQTITYDDTGMFPAKLLDESPIKALIDIWSNTFHSPSQYLS